MPRGVAHPPDVRARAEALLLAGHSQAEVCALTELPKQSVSDIAARIESKLGLVRTKKTESDVDLMLGYLRAALLAMTSQAEVFGDPAYCRTQDADKLAISHGVLGDKLAGVAATAQALGIIGPAARRDNDRQVPALDV